MRFNRYIIILILFLMATSAKADSFRFFEDPEQSSWASFAYDGSGNYLACNYGGHLFRWSPAQGFLDLGQGHPQSGSIGISADGSTICATRIRPQDGYLNPALWSPQRGWLDLGYTLDGCVINDSWGSGFDLSDDGNEAVGLCWTCTGAQAFHWDSESGMTALANHEQARTSRATAIAGNGSRIVGFIEHPQHGFHRPASWPANGSTHSFYAGYETRGEALAVNTTGDMIVGYHLSNQVEQAHYWTPIEGLVSLGSLSQSAWDASRATHVSDHGAVFGTSTHKASDVTECFYWDSFDGMVRLQDLLDNQGAVIPDDLWLDEILAVSSDGIHILGSWRDAQGSRGHWIAETSQPMKGRISECLVSSDGLSLDMNFELSTEALNVRPTLLAIQDDQQREIALQFQGATCQGVDHLVDLDGSGKVVYELALETNGQRKILERFSIWTDAPAPRTNSLVGALFSRTEQEPGVHIRVEDSRHLPFFPGTHRDLGRIIHIQWR